jgi:molecular chaperone GrpE
MSQTPWDEKNVEDANEQEAQQAGAEPTEGADEMSKLREERDQMVEKVARVQADFRNAQRRLEQDKEQAIQFANSGLVKSLIPVIDNLERALAVDPSKVDGSAILKGVKLVQDQLAKVLAQMGVEVEDPKPGTPFDPSRHEALMHQPSDKYKEPTVVQALQKGYVMHGRTLRAAGVAVSP